MYFPRTNIINSKTFVHPNSVSVKNYLPIGLSTFLPIKTLTNSRQIERSVFEILLSEQSFFTSRNLCFSRNISPDLDAALIQNSVEITLLYIGTFLPIWTLDMKVRQNCVENIVLALRR